MAEDRFAEAERLLAECKRLNESVGVHLRQAVRSLEDAAAIAESLVATPDEITAIVIPGEEIWILRS